MAFEEHKKRKFQFGNPYADFEYVNKNSRKTGPGLVLALLFGIALLVLAWWRFSTIAALEETGGTISLTSIEWVLYKVAGKWGVTVVLILLSGVFFYTGIRNYQRLEKIKNS